MQAPCFRLVPGRIWRESPGQNLHNIVQFVILCIRSSGAGILEGFHYNINASSRVIVLIDMDIRGKTVLDFAEGDRKSLIETACMD